MSQEKDLTDRRLELYDRTITSITTSLATISELVRDLRDIIRTVQAENAQLKQQLAPSQIYKPAPSNEPT